MRRGLEPPPSGRRPDDAEEEAATAGDHPMGPGRALDGRAQVRFSQLLAAPFGDVRIHSGAPARSLLRRHGARALTLGRSIAMEPERYPLGTLEGDALLAHELVHVSETAAPRPMAETTGRPEHSDVARRHERAHERAGGGSDLGQVIVDQSSEARADRGAVGAIASRLGQPWSPPSRGERRGGLRLQACPERSGPTAAQRGALSRADQAFDDTPLLQRAIRQRFGGRGLPGVRFGDVPAGHEGSTDSGTTTLTSSAEGFGSARLAALIAHETSHHRDPTNWGSTAEWVEGNAYAIEMAVLESQLRDRGSTMTEEEREEVRERLRVIGRLRERPPVLHSIRAAYQQNFDRTLGAMQILYAVIRGRDIEWGDAGRPPPIDGLSRENAERALVELLTRPAAEMTEGNGTAAQLLRWMDEHRGQVPALGLQGVVDLLGAGE